MSCFMRCDVKGHKRNKEIERQLEKDKNDAQEELKYLLLGAEKSGKSTYLKQLKIKFGSGYSDEDKRSFVKHVYQNIFMAMQSMVKAMDLFRIEYKDQSNYENARLILGVDFQTVTTFEIEFVNAIRALWNDPGIKECCDRGREYPLPDSAKYFLSGLERIALPDYLPNQQDILHLRIPTTGLVEYSFNSDCHRNRVIDASAIHSDKKWIHIFDNVHVLMFFASLSEYDQMSLGSENKNLMEENLALFKRILAYPWFEGKSAIVLLLNKKDIFEEKIMVSDLVDYFPDYDGPKQDHIAARQFISRKYLEQRSHEWQFVFFLYTNITDERDSRTVFEHLEFHANFVVQFGATHNFRFLEEYCDVREYLEEKNNNRE